MAIESVFGELPENWETTTLGDICQRGGGFIQTGPFGSQLHAADYVEVGIPTIMPKNIGENEVIEEGISRITQKDAERLSKYRVKSGDIVYSRRGDVTLRAFIREQQNGWLCGTGSLMVRLGDGVVDPRFVSFYLSDPSIREWIQRHAVGATMPNLNTSIMGAVPFIHPPLPEQRAIAGILGALDDKIELNRRMNHTLESMARAVFRQWFVENIDVDTWEVKTLGEVLSVLETGSRPKGGVTGEPIGVPSVGAESIVKIGSFDFSKTKYVSTEFYESMRRGHVEDRDVLLYKDGGRPGEFEPHVSMFGGGFPFERFSINEHVYRLRVATPLSQVYFYFWLESDEIMEEMRSRGTGVAIPGLNSTALSGISISIPPEKLLNEFTNYAEPLISKIFANAKESRTLASLRDTLLPKLMKGEVRVK